MEYTFLKPYVAPPVTSNNVSEMLVSFLMGQNGIDSVSLIFRCFSRNVQQNRFPVIHVSKDASSVIY
jgi:hypothetical protein